MKRFKNILYFADGESAPSPALQRALRLADTNGARLTVVDVLEPLDTPGEIASRLNRDLREILAEQRQQVLDELAETSAHDNTLIYTKVLFGIPFVEVIRAVKLGGYDLVVKSARCPAGLSERLFGSNDMHLLRKCPCPVWIDRPNAAPHYTHILAAVDPMAPAGEGCDDQVMSLASSLAVRESASLSVAHAWHLDGESMLRHGRLRVPAIELQQLLQGAEDRHREKLAALLGRYGLSDGDPAVHLVKGEAAPSIRQLAEQLPADLIVMGTVGRSGIPGFFIGNTAEEVLQTTQASVLAVKPGNFVSPVT
ncbi:MAG: universal stress protein [Chromatiaceae bacterium]|nr:universal stress protein [Chromatiaceae bacterium]